MLTFGSVCSGIEAASVAWEPLGWRAVWFAEVDRAASDVLAYRFPNTPNHGDMTLLADKVLRREIPAPDVLVGGTPCQAFSVAGLRGGLQDARGQLTLAFVILADAIDCIRRADGLEPCIIVWENVPGVLNHKDNPFGCFLAGIAGEVDPLVAPGKRWTNAGVVCGPERAISWRILDAQYFGLAQRRRRVFVVASARQGFDPGSILLEFEGVRRDSPPSRNAGQDAAGAAGASVAGSGEPRSIGVGQDARQERCGRAGDANRVDRLGGSLGLTFAKAVCPTLRAGGNQTGGDRPPGTDVDTADSLLVYDRAPFCMAHGQGGAEVREDLAPTLTCNHEAPIAFEPYAFQPRIARNGRGDMGDLVHALNAQSGETGKGDAAPCVAYAIQERAVCENPNAGPVGIGVRAVVCAYTLEARSVPQAIAVLPFDTTQISSPGNYSRPDYGDPCHPLAAGAHPPAVCVTGDITHCLKAEGFDASEDGTGRGQSVVPCGFQSSQSGVRINETAGTLDANYGSRRHNGVLTELAVRRLMPVECERLQGFPDNWTLVPTGKTGKPAADGPRYKQCGNSMATRCMNWIGRRIQQHIGGMGHNGGPVFDDFDEVLG